MLSLRACLPAGRLDPQSRGKKANRRIYYNIYKIIVRGI